MLTLKTWQAAKETLKIIKILNKKYIASLIHDRIKVLKKLPKRIKLPVIIGCTNRSKRFHQIRFKQNDINGSS
ncbi:hypothetical protein AOQ87_00015 (plasmid) [Candidatus Riesia pediculischaeffi]|uniref:Uncharacterized protein n=1 Tax=Candidatus Riesia pediculischaeffi TaxID=428411 RepID=A0A1V0HJT6_9ENTR|nr:hypothetical protein AOQ87_00015 [Candidatus Riesia pediculischaeffi]